MKAVIYFLLFNFFFVVKCVGVFETWGWVKRVLQTVRIYRDAVEVRLINVRNGCGEGWGGSYWTAVVYVWMTAFGRYSRDHFVVFN